MSTWLMVGRGSEGAGMCCTRGGGGGSVRRAVGNLDGGGRVPNLGPEVG